MPTSTFFNLPQEKREAILGAARKEFARVTFRQASINKIIADAEISRGSFYMYFKDKKDLLFCVLGEYVDQLDRRIEEVFEGSQGDIFAVFIQLYDATLEYGATGEDANQTMRTLFNSLHSGVFHSAEEIDMPELLNQKRESRYYSYFSKLLNTSQLSVSGEEEFEDLAYLLSSATKHGICQALLPANDPVRSRERFIKMLRMIQHGVAKQS